MSIPENGQGRSIPESFHHGIGTKKPSGQQRKIVNTTLKGLLATPSPRSLGTVASDPPQAQ